MAMKSEVGVCSEEEVGGGVGEGKGKGYTIMSQRSEMEAGVCDRVDATESMRQSRCDRVDGMEVKTWEQSGRVAVSGVTRM